MCLVLFLGSAVFLSAHFVTSRLLGLSGLQLLNFAPRSAEGSPGRRIAARFSGPVAIYLVAATLFMAYALTFERFSSRVRLVPGMPAAHAGVQDGDRVVALDGVSLRSESAPGAPRLWS